MESTDLNIYTDKETKVATENADGRQLVYDDVMAISKRLIEKTNRHMRRL